MNKEQFINDLREHRHPLHSKCLGLNKNHPCSKIECGIGLCSAYWNPSAKWRLGDCPLADPHLRTKKEIQKEKQRQGQQKHAKVKK